MSALREKLPCLPQLPATGQTRCYNTAGTVIPCASPDWPGQDGFYQASCSTTGRFTDNGDGTVTDSCTNLMWQKQTAPGTYTWQEALQYCDNLSLAGRSDWKLPNERELHTLVDYGRINPSINPVFQVVATDYWSSTSYVNDPQFAWVVWFWSGSQNVSMANKETYRVYVRAVRTVP